MPGLATLFNTRTVLCDGAMGTSLYNRGVFLNKCFDELNLMQPEVANDGDDQASLGEWEGQMPVQALGLAR